MSCEATGTAKVKLRLSRKAARKLGLASRRVAVKSVRCTAGETVTVKVRAEQARRARRWSGKAPKSLRIAISVALGGLEYTSVDRPLQVGGTTPGGPASWRSPGRAFVLRWGPHEISDRVREAV